MRLNKLFLAIFAAGAAIFSCSCGGGGGGGSTPPDNPPPGHTFVKMYLVTTMPGGNVERIAGPRTTVYKGTSTAEFADAIATAVVDNLKAWLASGNAPSHFASTREARRLFLLGHGSQILQHEAQVVNYVLQNEPQVFADVRQAAFYTIDIQNDEVEQQARDSVYEANLELLVPN